jgi:anti-sigma factor RsiW
MHGYLDGELDLSASLQCEQHLRECPTCATALAQQKALQTAMKADGLYFKAPEGLREALRSSVRRANAGGTGGITRIPWRWLGAAACLIVCVGLGFLLGQLALMAPRDERLAQEVFSSHVRSLQIDRSRLLDIGSSDRHRVKPWFTDKLDFSPPVKDPANKGFPLIGGRLDYLDGRPVATLVYQRREHIISVFVWPDAASEDTQPRRETRLGYHLVHWSRAGMTHWAVSDLDPTELGDFVQQLWE